VTEQVLASWNEEAEPFDAFTVRPAAVAVYQLGNSGAARKLLRTWPTPN
jgi:hypothetical protein